MREKKKTEKRKTMIAGIAKIGTVGVFGLMLLLDQSSCESAPLKSDLVQQQQQEKMREEANAQAGMPGIQNFTEMKMMKMLYELRDQEITTFTYVPDYGGRLWHVCDSIGYGLPYGTQYSNPEKIVPFGYGTYSPNTSHVIPQSEPNGLFMPPTAEGTWVMCGTKKEIHPVYVEPRVVVSPMRLRTFGEWAAEEKQ